MEIRKLNTLRGLAAIIVLLAHFSNEYNWLKAAFGSKAGQIGVMLFFILSGFLMSYLYLNKESNSRNLKHYAIARTARVVPLFLLVVFASYALQQFNLHGILYDIPNTSELLSHLLLIKGVSVLWSIGPEIQFYFLFVLIWLFFVKKDAHLYMLIALSLTALFFTGFTFPKGTVGGLNYELGIIRSLPYFLVGVIIGKLYGQLTISSNLQSNWFIASLLLILLIYPKIFFAITGFAHGMWADMGILAIVSMVFFIIVFLVPDQNFLLANKVGDFVGKISYSIYLLHMPILWQLNKLNLQSIELTFLIYLISTLAISYLSYKIIEAPSAKLIRKFIQ